MVPLFSTLWRKFYLHWQNQSIAVWWQTLIRVPFFQKKGKAFLNVLKITFKIEKGMLFLIKQLKRWICYTFQFPLWAGIFLIIELPESFTDSWHACLCFIEYPNTTKQVSTKVRLRLDGYNTYYAGCIKSVTSEFPKKSNLNCNQKVL